MNKTYKRLTVEDVVRLNPNAFRSDDPKIIGKRLSCQLHHLENPSACEAPDGVVVKGR